MGVVVRFISALRFATARCIGVMANFQSHNSSTHRANLINAALQFTRMSFAVYGQVGFSFL